jgi:hypothetical protein
LKRANACKTSLVAELPFNSQELVKLRHALAAASGTRLQLSGAHRHREICDSRVFRLA